MSQKLSTSVFILKSKSIYGDRFDYSKSVYINAIEKILIRCIKHNHWFEQNSNNHYINQSCNVCRVEKQRELYATPLNEFKSKVKEKLGKNISFKKVDYVNQRSPITIICKIHNIEITKPASAFLNGQGCNLCSKERLIHIRSEITLNYIKKFISAFNGKVLSKNYINKNKNLLFECDRGHKFKKTWNAVKHSLRWCPKCSKNKLIGEELARQMLEHALKIKFPSKYIEEMEGLQLDGYNPIKKIAFEYQGYQHYTKDSHFHKSDYQYTEQLQRDKLKKELCHKNNITLLEINEFKTIRRNRISKFYKDVCLLLKGENLNINSKPFEINLYDLYHNKPSSLYDSAKEKVENAGGEIEDYIGSESFHNYKCKKGHLVKGRVLSSIISSNASCPICKDENMLYDLKKSVESRGGKLIDKKWKGVLADYNWVCDKGHKNKSKGSVLKNYWCIQCQRENLKVKLTNRQLNDLIKDATRGKLYQKDIPLKYGISDSIYTRIIDENKVNVNYLPQDRTKQNINNKSKGRLLQLDPKTLHVIKVYQTLESVKRDKENNFTPENIRFQMKRFRKAFGYYWCREQDYERIKAIILN